MESESLKLLNVTINTLNQYSGCMEICRSLFLATHTENKEKTYGL